MDTPYRELSEAQEVDDLMQPGAGPVVFDFWSSTCAPCKRMAPGFEAVAKAHAEESITFVKIRTDTHPQLAAPFSIRSVPTLLFVHDGEILDAVVGFMDEQRLNKKVQWLLSKASGEGILTRLFGGSRKR